MRDSGGIFAAHILQVDPQVSPGQGWSSGATFVPKAKIVYAEPGFPAELCTVVQGLFGGRPLEKNYIRVSSSRRTLDWYRNLAHTAAA